MDDLYNNSTETTSSATAVPVETIIGLILAFSSCFFIGISVIYKKLALREVENCGGTRAVDGGYGYLKLPKWWFGIILMGVGELTNFVAYIYAPAILVTPLGVFSIVCTATLSPYLLQERLRALGKIGCILVLVGCVIVTLCGPKDREVSTMEELQEQLLNVGFLIYSFLVILISSVLMGLVPKYGHKYVMLYITICSSFGSLSVMFCKGVGLALKQTVAGTNQFSHWATWVCLISLILCLVIETVYMQRALDLFSSSVFMSVNYVMFTSLVIIASSILYTELRELGAKNIILTILGFIVNITALYLLHLDKTDCLNRRNQCISTSTNTKENIQQATPLLQKYSYNMVEMENKKNANHMHNATSADLENKGRTKSAFKTNDNNSYISLMNERERSTGGKLYNNNRSISSSSNDIFISRDESTNDYEILSNNSFNSVSSQPKICINDNCIKECMCNTPLVTELQTSTLKLKHNKAIKNQVNIKLNQEGLVPVVSTTDVDVDSTRKIHDVLKITA